MNNMILWMILVAMWGSSYAAIKVGIEGLSPVVLVAGRLWIGAAILYLVLKLSGGRLASRKRDWFHYAFSGLLGSAVPFFLISYGEQSVDSALAAIFMGIAPVVTAAIAAAVFPDEKLSGRIVLGLVCGFGGVVMLVGPSALGQVGQNSTAQAAILAAALCYAGTTVYVRRFVKGPALATATGATLVAALATTAPAVTSVVTQSAIAGTSALLAMVYLGVFSTAAANLIYFHLVPRLGATRMAQVNFAVPVAGALIGAVALGEQLTLLSVSALAVICASVFLVTSRRMPGSALSARKFGSVRRT